MHVLSMLCQPVPHDHGVSYCRSGAEYQCHSEDVVRTDSRGLVRGSARCLTGGHFRL